MKFHPGVLGAALLVVAVASPAAAFKRSTTSSKDSSAPALYWESRTVTWHAADPLGIDDEESALRALRASARAWESPSCTDLRLEEGSRSTHDVGYSRKGNNQNVLLFRTEGSCEDAVPRGDRCVNDETCGNKFDCWDYSNELLAVTTTTFDRCGRILDADIEFNGGNFDFTSVDGPTCSGAPDGHCVAFDVENTATHEMGHLLGLDHPPGPAFRESTMFASAGKGETDKRDLAADDIDGICTIYPEGEPPAATVSAASCKGSAPEKGGCSAAPEGGAASLLLAFAALAARRRRRG